MNITFILDVKLKENNGKYYTTGAVDKEYLKKYQFYEENKLNVICRKDETKNIEGLACANGKNIQFNCINNYMKIKNKKEDFINIIKNSDLCIVKMSSILGIVLLRYIRKYNKKYVVELVGDAPAALWYNKGVKGKILAPFFYLITRWILKRAENVIYVTNKYLQKRYPNNKKNIGLSDVMIGKPNQIILERRLKKINDLKCNEIIKLGLIGSVDNKYKGHKIAIKALKCLLKEKYNNIELHFIGGGNPDNIEKFLNEDGLRNKVFLDGILARGKEVNKWLDGIDILLMPSLIEGMPRTLIEASSRACPCIGTEVGGIPELLEKEYIIKKNDYKSLAMKIKNLISNKNEMKKVAKRNFLKSMEFDEEILLEKRNKFYNSVIEE